MTQKNLSAFGTAAVALDNAFTDLQEFGGQLERLTIDSESGLERAKTLLAKFSACGQQVGEDLQKMAAELNEARARAEKTAEAVSARALEIQQRQQDTDRLIVRFGALGEAFKKVSAEIVALQKPTSEDGALSEADRARIVEHLPKIDAELATLSSDAWSLKEEAQSVKMKALEKNADSLAQSLTTMRNRIGSFIEKPATLH